MNTTLFEINSMDHKFIRNFCIIAHIDHGKSTLADRMLEMTGTVERRKMKAQFLDQMELEQERGITIKLQPVTMVYRPSEVQNANLKMQNYGVASGRDDNNPASLRDTKIFNFDSYTLNLIDTPGHIDFTYEVSRSLAAVDGAILLVDATQGVQAQTMTNVEMARSMGLTIIPVLNKIDLPHARVEESAQEVMKLLDCEREDILKISAKTGEGVEELLQATISRFPAPRENEAEAPRALIFDYEYSVHQGIIAYIRVFDGAIKKGDELKLAFSGEKIVVGEIGVLVPQKKILDGLASGEIGYIATNIKKAEIVRVGDTVISAKNPLPALPGYSEPKPVVWASVYPSAQDDFEDMRSALQRLHLTDSAFSFEPESDQVLGRGFRCGFLGMLHMEIVIERLRREFGIEMIVATPTVSYEVTQKNGEVETIYSPSEFPDEHAAVQIREPWIHFDILAPESALSGIIQLLQDHRASIESTDIFGVERLSIKGFMATRELMRGFFDKLKSVSHGYASFNYEFYDMREANVVRLDIMVAEERVSAFSRIVAHDRVESEGRRMVEKLHEVLPQALFTIKIQAMAQGRIIASHSLSAMKKDVTGYLYGGDRTRKMKLWQKQKKGKKRLEEQGKVNITQDVFVAMIKE
jgi:GTP-binding protein LepA